MKSIKEIWNQSVHFYTHLPIFVLRTTILNITRLYPQRHKYLLALKGTDAHSQNLYY